MFLLIRKDEHLLVFLSTLWFCPLFLVAQLFLTLCDPVDCDTPDFPVRHRLLEFAQTRLLRRWCLPNISSSVVPFVLAGLQIWQLPSSSTYLSLRGPDPWLGYDVFAWVSVGRVQWTIHSTCSGRVSVLSYVSLTKLNGVTILNEKAIAASLVHLEWTAVLPCNSIYLGRFVSVRRGEVMPW